MTITTERVGRELHIHVEGVEEPFIAKPLPGRAGIQITETYLGASVGIVDAEQITSALIMAVDGGHRDESTGRWEPVPVDEQTTFARIGDELSQAESEDVLLAAFFWQTLLGESGVRAFTDAGCGLAGTLAATTALSARLGRLAAASPAGASVA